MISTWYVPACAVAMLQVPALPLASALQSKLVVVGALPNFTYMSASPLPPALTNFRPVAPAGTASVHTWLLPAALLARRSVFLLRGRALMVSEAFLPAILELRK